MMEGEDVVSLAGSQGEANQDTAILNPIKNTVPQPVPDAAPDNEQPVLNDNSQGNTEGVPPPPPPPMPDVKPDKEQSVLHDNSLGNTEDVQPPVTNNMDKEARADLMEQIRNYQQSKKAAGKDKTVSAGGGKLTLDPPAKQPETVQEMLLSSTQFISQANLREADNTENANAEGMGADDGEW